VQWLVFHAESEPHIDNRLNMIRARGVRTGIALKPATPLSTLEYVLDKCDTVLLMLINPGYAGNRSEGQVPYADRKIRELRKMIEARGLDTKIEIDGRISKENMAEYGTGEVDIFVAGSTCLKRDDLKNSAAELVRFRENIVKGGRL